MLILELQVAIKYIACKKNKLLLSIHSALAIIGILIATASLIILLSIVNGFASELVSRAIGMGAHIQVNRFGGETNPDKTLKKILTVKHVTSASPFILGQAVLIYGKEYYVLNIQGVDHNKEAITTAINKKIIKGEVKNKGGSIIIGKQLAEQFCIGLGRTIELFYPFTMKRMRFKVAGIFYSGIYSYDFGTAYMSIDDAGELFSKRSSIDGYKIKVEEGFDVLAVRDAIHGMLDQWYDVYAWSDINKNLVSLINLEKKIMIIIVLLALCLAGLIIFSTQLMSVISNRKEIGVLMSMGFSRASIMRIFVFQGMILGAIGILVGCVAGMIISNNINTIADALSALTGSKMFPEDLYYMSKIPVKLTKINVISTILFSSIITILASLYPSYQASKLDPVKVLRNE